VKPLTLPTPFRQHREAETLGRIGGRRACFGQSAQATLAAPNTLLASRLGALSPARAANQRLGGGARRPW
jgi:hypothetical protein